MNEADRNGISAMRDIWITGGAAQSMAPLEWQHIIADAEANERECLLLAIAGQALDVGFRPAAPKSLERRQPLPKLSLPSLPERLRPLFRSALRNASDNRGKLRVVSLLAARGYVVHPLDWMPAASEFDAPRAYAPWVDWQDAARIKGPLLDNLAEENWDDFYPAARRIALADIRRTDPARARALLQAKALSEPAEKRLPLIELLRVNLSVDDAPYLETLAKDRSGKIQQLATRLLARIGKAQSGTEADEQVKELADFIEQSKTGLLRRRTVFAPKALKSWAQINRRSELFQNCQLVDLTARFGVSQLDFVEAWQMGGKDSVDSGFAGMVAESGNDEAVSKFAQRVIEAADASAFLLLLPRLSPSASRTFAKMVLAQGANATHLLSGADIEAGTFETNDLISTATYKAMRAQVANRKPDDRGSAPDFSLFGHLATAATAEAIVADLTAAGLASADPSLALLRLNATLSEPKS